MNTAIVKKHAGCSYALPVVSVLGDVKIATLDWRGPEQLVDEPPV
jgi:hypothetical protein